MINQNPPTITTRLIAKAGDKAQSIRNNNIYNIIQCYNVIKQSQ
jgi:hypothetical protein